MSESVGSLVESILAQAKAHLADGRLQRAAECFNRILALVPEHVEASLGLRSLREQGLATASDSSPVDSLDWSAQYAAGPDTSVDLPPTLNAARPVAGEVEVPSNPDLSQVQSSLGVATDPMGWSQVEFSSDGVDLEPPSRAASADGVDSGPPSPSVASTGHHESFDGVSEVVSTTSNTPRSEPVFSEMPVSGLPPNDRIFDTLEESLDEFVEPNDVDSMVVLIESRIKAGNYDSVSELLDSVLQENPNHSEILRLKTLNDEKRLQRMESTLGDLTRCLRLNLRQEEMVWQSLNHHEGFVLSQVDGITSIEDIIDIAGLPRAQVIEILVKLIKQGLLAD